MSTSTDENVKLICVKYKSSDSLGKVKLKLLRAMRRAERQSRSVNTTISHPLQPWNNHCHTIGELPANDILITLSNSRYIVFLTKDGRVCRLKCTSRPELSQKSDSSIASLLSSLRRGPSSTHGLSFQEESDAEYARQLQAEYEAQSHRSSLGHHPTYFGRAGSPSTVLEELDREARAYMYLGMSSHPWPPEPSYRVSPRFSLRDDSPVPVGAFGRDSVVLGAADARSGDSPPPDYSSLFGDRRSSGGPPVQVLGTMGGEGGGASGQGQSSKGKVLWPEMGSLEWLVCKQNPDSTSHDNKFVAMAVLHSEILLVSAESRQLYSWSCSDHTPSSSRQLAVVPHPLNEELGLLSERITLLESSDVRATVVTETGKVATFYDSLLRVSLEEDAPSLVQSLTHPAETFPELEGESVAQLSVSNFITTAVTSSGKVFWWGLCPKDKETTNGTSTSNNQDNQTSGGHRPTPSSSRSRSRGAIVDGSLVRLKNGPPCGPNSIVYSRSPCGPHVGKTMNIIEHGSLDPKTSVLVKVFKDDYRVNSDSTKKVNWMDYDSNSRLLSDLDSSLNYNSLEVWKLSDVVFLDDSPAILGRVVTVDYPQAIVDISHSTSESGTLASSSNAKSTLKVFKVSELELCPVDYRENSPQSQPRSQQPKKKVDLSASSSSEAKPSLNRGGVSHHVAGTVQHHPVCILAPELNNTHNPTSSMSGNVPSSLLQQQGAVNTNPGSVIYGYTPLAVHTTDEGPTMLVERISDSATFIVYSGHSSAGSGALVSTSFVALNSKDSKPNLFTIEEESVLALEGGFRADPVVLSYNSTSNDDRLQVGGDGDGKSAQKSGARSKVTKGKAKAGSGGNTASKSMEVELQDATVGATKPFLPQRRSSRKRKLDKNGKTSTAPQDQSASKLQAPENISDKSTITAALNSPKKSDLSSKSFQSSPSLRRPPMAKLNSQPLLIWDVNGKVCPLLDGLNLRPVPSSKASSNLHVPLPTMSYRCVTSRQHAISKTQNVFVLALVCRAQSLMPAVQSGNVMKVDAILNSLKSGDTSTDGEATQHDSNENQPTSHQVKLAEEDEDPPVAKRLKLTSTLALPTECGDRNEQAMEESSSKLSERLKSLSDIPSEMSFETEIPILEKSATTATTKLQSSNEQPSSQTQEGESSSGVYADEKVDSMAIFFETTVHNSNVLHVCCQLNESVGGGGAKTTTISGKATAESSILKIPSWLKLTPSSPEMSFEERRHSYMFSRKREKGRRSMKELQAMSLTERRLEILDSLLSCEEIQPIVMKLLSSRNADGKTPFMTSICSQNYAAALKILDYLEEWSINQQKQQLKDRTTSTVAVTDSEFFKNSILSPWRNGATPIQALLASLSPFYDIRSMRLYVFNLPASYTAQHLLKLFQLRYPSAFKAEILKGDRDEDGGEGVGSSGEEDGEDDGWSSGEDGEGGEEGESRRQQGGAGGESSLLSGLRRAAARRRRGYRRRTTYSLGGGVSSIHPRRGIVHFSNVVELRAAAKEMNDYRMITTVSRSTGFGQTQSIHYLNVHMESLSDSDDDGDPPERGLGISTFTLDDFHPLSRLGNSSLRSSHRGSGLGRSRRKSSKGKTAAASKLSSPILAFQLLQKLLSYQQLVTARDNAGETALSSLVHNSRCLQSLRDLQKSLTNKDEAENSPENRSQLPGTRTPISTSGLGSSSSLGMPTTSSGRPIRSFTTLAELMKSQEEETKSALNIDRSVPTLSSPSTSSSTGPVGARGTTVMPYVSLADWLDQFFTKIQGTSLEENLPKFLTETQQMLQNTGGGSTSSDGNTESVPKTEEGKEEFSFTLSKRQEVATSTPKPKAVGQSSASASTAESVTEKVNALLSAAKERKEGKKEVSKTSVASQILKATAPFVKNTSTCTKAAEAGSSMSITTESNADDAPKSKRLQLGTTMLIGESDSTMMTPILSFTPSEPSPLESSERTSPEKGQTPGEEQQESDRGEQATDNDIDVGAQMLQALVTNWPCIVATILGFYPPCVTKLVDRTCTLEDSNACDTLQESMEGVSVKNCDNSSTTLEFSTVHSVDSFVTNLILNCEDATIDTLVAAIVERMNSAVFKSTSSGNEIDLPLLSESVDFTTPPEDVCALNEHNVSLLVGVRFMNSVVRLLGLEHSRVKNAFVEMQQLRLSNAEGRGRGDRDRHSVGRLIAEGASTFMEYDRPLGGGRERRNSTPRKNITATVKHILGQFSWLAVHSLSEAAEAASAPVRIGVAKPLGASSVLPEYQGVGRSSYSSHVYNLPSTNHGSSSLWSLARQLHVRTPQAQAKRRRMERRGTQQSCSTLPADGIILRPCPKDQDGDQCSGGEAGLGGGVTSNIMGGASIHDESFEDDFSDMEGSVTDGLTDVPSTSGTTADHITPNFVTELSLPPEVTGEIFLDLDPSSSDDDSMLEFPPDSVLHGTASQGGTTEGDNIDDIYPFAWALDGRRIGENSDANARPTSPTGGSLFINSEPMVPLTSIPSIRFGAGFLARTFARFVKDLVDVAKDIADKKAPQCCLKLPPDILKVLMNSTMVSMEKTWQWVASVLDVAEGQLRQGQYFETQRHVVSLRSGSTRNHSSSRPGQVARVSRSFIGSTPGEYITYLLRTHAREDRECLPVLDLYGYEHVVYMLDGLIYTVNNWPKTIVTTSLNSNHSGASEPSVFEPTNQNTASDNSKLESHQMEVDDNSKTTSKTESQYRFFQRTESVTITTGDDPEIQRHNEQFFGTDGTATTLALEQPELAGPPTPWRAQDGRFSQPLNEAYPLAQKPHLLKPFAKKEHLFSSSISSEGSSELERGEERGNRPRLSVSYSNPITSAPAGPITMSWSVEEIQQRWHSAISVFAHIFLAEGPGSERSNFLNAKAGFASRMARFRHLVQQLFDASQLTRDWAGTVSSTLTIRIRREHLLLDSIDLLKQLVRFHYTTTRVKFDGEDGSGPGVNRGFFASLASELKSSDLTKQPMNRLGQFFHEPGKKPEQSGLYAPCPFSRSGLSLSAKHTIYSQRKTAFQAIGRYLGLCLWFRYTVPFMVCRHVAKFFLGRELAWHDLAFYNADLYEGLRRMMLDAEEGKKDQEEFVATYCCYFEAPLCGQNGDSKLVELIPGGSKIPVTQQRVREYVRLYAMFLMVECVREELQAMKDGLNDVIPAELLSGLTAEDFQLLLSGGSADISISRLKSVIRFNHTHGNSTTVCDRFEKMFWRVVSHMTNAQRQQLLYFATGSATLPASADANTRNPAVAITIDVISSSSIASLPVASTCSQRMSIPLYPSYQLLKKKLLQAVQCQAYGLG